MYDENLIQFQSNDDQNLEISFIWDLERNRLVDTIQDAKDFNWQENFIQTGFNLYLSDEKHITKILITKDKVFSVEVVTTIQRCLGA